MTLTQYHIKIEHEKFGSLMKETFVDPIQFKLFLKMIHGCLVLKNDLTFFNGVDFLVHIPFENLTNSNIITSTPHYSAADVLISKSKIEAEVTK
jgi:hypothetical protein